VKRELGDGYELDDDRTRIDRDAVHVGFGSNERALERNIPEL
jgi:hypothetical protein